MTKYTAKKANELRIPVTSTPENLEGWYGKTITFGSYTIIAGYYFNGIGQNSFYWAAFKNKGGIEDEANLKAVGKDFYEDDGHALAGALNWIAQRG